MQPFSAVLSVPATGAPLREPPGAQLAFFSQQQRTLDRDLYPARTPPPGFRPGTALRMDDDVIKGPGYDPIADEFQT